IHNGAVAFHHIARAHSAQAFNNSYLCIAGAGGVTQEPADKRYPEPAEAGTAEKTNQPKRDEAERHKLTYLRRNSRRAVGLARRPPDNGPQYPATVQRKARNHVEDGQRNIDVAEPDEHG